MAMSRIEGEASIVQLLRLLKRLGLLSNKTYIKLGNHLMTNGEAKKDAWRQANWKAFLKNG